MHFTPRHDDGLSKQRSVAPAHVSRSLVKVRDFLFPARKLPPAISLLSLPRLFQQSSYTFTERCYLLRLTAGEIGGVVTSWGVAATTILMGLVYLWDAKSIGGGVGIAMFCFSQFLSEKQDLRRFRKREKTIEYERVEQTLSALAASSKKECPEIFDRPGCGNFMIATSLWYKPRLIFDSHVVTQIDQSDLRQILAHEVSHLKTSLLSLTTVHALVKVGLQATTWAMSTLYLSTALPCSGIFQRATNVCVSGVGGLVSMLAAQYVVNSLWAIALRSHELKTDLKAANLTGEYDQYCVALKRITGLSSIRVDDLPVMLRLLSTHPNDKTRCSMLIRMRDSRRA